MSLNTDNSELAMQLRRAIPPYSDPRTKELFARTFNALRRAGLASKKDVMDAYPVRLLCLEGFGLGSLRVIEMAFFPGGRFIAKAEKCVYGEPMDVHHALAGLHGCIVDADAEPSNGRIGGE